MGSSFLAYSEIKIMLHFWFTSFNQNKKAVALNKTTACELFSLRPMIFLKSAELPRTATSYASHCNNKQKLTTIKNIIWFSTNELKIQTSCQPIL